MGLKITHRTKRFTAHLKPDNRSQQPNTRNKATKASYRSPIAHRPQPRQKHYPIQTAKHRNQFTHNWEPKTKRSHQHNNHLPTHRTKQGGKPEQNRQSKFWANHRAEILFSNYRQISVGPILK